MKGLALLICLGSLLFFAGLGDRDFWAPDEGDFAQITKELAGDLVVPRLNGTPYAEKPPLYYYLLYASKALQPVFREEVSLRIPSALFALLMAAGLFVTARRSLGNKIALASGLVLLSAPLFYWQARYVQVDMVFSSLLCLSLFSYIGLIETGRTPFLYLTAALLGGAFLTKGPLALALTVPPMAVASFFQRRRIHIPPLHVFLAAALFATVVLPWYVAVYLREGLPFLYENVLRQNLTRFTEAWSHRRPFYYYVTTLPADFFPWSLLLPLGIYRACRVRPMQPGLLFLLLFSAWAFLFLSASSGKISKYMLPLLPALSLFVAMALEEPWNRYQKAVFLFLSVVLAAGGALLVYGPQWIPPQFRRESIVVAAFLLAGAAGMALCLRSNARASGAVLFLTVFLTFLAANLFVYGKINDFKSPRFISEEVASLVSDGTPWAYYGSMRGVYVYYVGKQAVHINEHDKEGLKGAAKDRKRLVILTRKRDAGEVTEALPGSRIVSQRKVGDSDMTILEWTGNKL